MELYYPRASRDKDVRIFQGQINTVHSGTARNEESININMYREVKRRAEKKNRINKSYSDFRACSEKPRGLHYTVPSAEKQRDYNDKTI